MASLAAFAFVAAATATIGCTRSERAAVGLIFLPAGAINPQSEHRIATAVFGFASERFRGSADTVDGMVYFLSSDGTTSRYLLLLPYGDRERSMVNDTAVAYGLTLQDSSAIFSQKYSIPLGAGREVHVLEAADIDGDGIAEALLCVRTNAGDRSILALALQGNALSRKEQTIYTAARCPPGEVMP